MPHEVMTPQIVKQLEHLPLELQQKILDLVFALAASYPKGTGGKPLLRFAGVIESTEIQAMKKTIEAGCERVDTDERATHSRERYLDCCYRQRA